MHPLVLLLIGGLGWFWGGMAMAVAVREKGVSVTGEMVRLWAGGSVALLVICIVAAIVSAG